MKCKSTAVVCRASGLNLVMNIIIPRNTTSYLAGATSTCEGRGSLPDELLSHVASIQWDRVALTGGYLWFEIESPRERFRPLRTNHFDPAQFQNP
jgi:hypothetical protein